MPFTCPKCGAEETGSRHIVIEVTRTFPIAGVDGDGDPIYDPNRAIATNTYVVCTKCQTKTSRWVGTDLSSIAEDEAVDPLTCSWCEEVYDPDDGYDENYCSTHCYNMAHNDCSHCGESFDPEESGHESYCSDHCADEDDRGHCSRCGDSFDDGVEGESGEWYCSTRCAKNAGDLSPHCYACSKPIDGEPTIVDRDGDPYCSLRCKKVCVSLTPDESEQLELEQAMTTCTWCGTQYLSHLSLAADPTRYCCPECEAQREATL